MRTFICTAAILALCGSVSAVAKPDQAALKAITARLKVPSTAVAELPKPLKPDEARDLAGWTGPLQFAHLAGRPDKAPPIKTVGYLARHGRTLYVAVRCFEPDMKSITGELVPRDGNVWAGDNVEIILQPGLEPSGP